MKIDYEIVDSSVNKLRNAIVAQAIMDYRYAAGRNKPVYGEGGGDADNILYWFRTRWAGALMGDLANQVYMMLLHEDPAESLMLSRRGTALKNC